MSDSWSQQNQNAGGHYDPQRNYQEWDYPQPYQQQARGQPQSPMSLHQQQQAQYGNQQMMYHHQQQQAYQQQRQPSQPPQQQRQGDYNNRRGGFGFNPNAAAFVPRSERSTVPPYGQRVEQTQAQQIDYFPPSYAGVPAYGNQREQSQQQYYQNQNYVHPAAPAMTSFYCDDADQAAYEAMYNQFGMSQHAQYVPSIDMQYKMNDSGSKMELQEIQVGLEQIMTEFDQFDAWALPIKDRMNQSSMDDDGRKNAIQLLCEMAVAVSPSTVQKGANPQYSFARLIRYLCDELPSRGLMGKCVMPVLGIFHDLRHSYELERKCNLLVFFGEVYSKTETEARTRVKILGDALLEQIEDILKGNSVTDAAMKNICHVMKLSGPDLDADPSTYEKVSDVLTRLSGFARGHPQLSETIKNQISILVEQRQKGWGGSRAALSSCSSVPAGAIIGADGAMLDLNEEELNFIESQLGALDDQDLDSSIDDTDVYKEFNQFVKEERQSKAAEMASSLMEKLKVDDGPDGGAAPPPSDSAAQA